MQNQLSYWYGIHDIEVDIRTNDLYNNNSGIAKYAAVIEFVTLAYQII